MAHLTSSGLPLSFVLLSLLGLPHLHLCLFSAPTDTKPHLLTPLWSKLPPCSVPQHSNAYGEPNRALLPLPKRAFNLKGEQLCHL